MARPRIRSTTILTVRKDGLVAMGGDGQVSLGDTVMKSDARKVRVLGEGRVAPVPADELRGPVLVLSDLVVARDLPLEILVGRDVVEGAVVEAQ